MTFHEHNNRKKADAFAEYITGEALRRLIADKARQLCGNCFSVFDGAAGSGQLQQFIQPAVFEAVEIQAESCAALKQNYPQAKVHQTSFFLYHSDFQADCVIMNPPFSMKFKDLSAEEQLAVRTLFPWKKSGVVDDIFILKSLEHTRRHALHICFPGIAYRQSEARMRQIIGSRLSELWLVKNAFEDTAIAVLLLVIDQHKTDTAYRQMIHDCKSGQTQQVGSDELNELCDWQMPREPEPEAQTVDIHNINLELNRHALAHLEKHMQRQLLVETTFHDDTDYLGFTGQAKHLINHYEQEFLAHRQSQR